MAVPSVAITVVILGCKRIHATKIAENGSTSNFLLQYKLRTAE